MRPGNHAGMRRESGFTYVAMLFALAVFATGLAAIGESWSAASHREKEEELIRIGLAYAQAIGSYYAKSPGSVKVFPRTLDDLVEDKRFVGTMRHLRRVYRDPFTGGEKWGIVPARDGGIAGVYSLSDKEALRRQGVTLPGGEIVIGARYADWKFVYQPKT